MYNIQQRKWSRNVGEDKNKKWSGMDHGVVLHSGVWKIVRKKVRECEGERVRMKEKEKEWSW